MSAWRRTYDLCLHVANGRDAVRSANLAIAAAAMDRDLRDGMQLRERVGELAVAGPVESDDSILAWQAIAEEARRSARALRGADGHDAWVLDFQAADPARKSRGAYATPRPLAEAMARLLLSDRERPPKRIVDPSAGGGALLVALLRRLAGPRPDGTALAAAVGRLHGVELDPVARELCCLQLWIACRGAEDVDSIAARIHLDNAIVRDWTADGPYDALTMNPPWDSLRHGGEDDRERARTVERMSTAREAADSSLPPLFSRQGRGDRNLYKAFLELAPHVVREGGAIVALVPGAWSSDLGTQPLRDLYLRHTAVDQWTSFENRRGYFPIDGRYKFGILRARRDPAGTRALRTRGMADDVSQLRTGHVRLSAAAIRAVGGPAQTIPDVAARSEVGLLRRMAARGIPFFDAHPQLGSVRYDREVDLTEDRKLGRFHRLEDVEASRAGRCRWRTPDGRQLRPLLEGRMVGQYDFFEKSWVEGSGRTAQWSYNNGHGLRACRPQFLAPPAEGRPSRIAICDVTSATNTRTVRATWIPPDWPCGNTAPVLAFDTEVAALAALAVLNSMVFDWQARRVVGGLHLNRFYLAAMNWPRLDDDTVAALAERALELSSLGRRFREAAPKRLRRDPSEVDYVEAHVAIETAVAAGYGLGGRELETIFDPDPGDRRGFWRAFASDPHATAIAERTAGAARVA